MERFNVKFRVMLLTCALITLVLAGGCNKDSVTEPVTQSSNENADLSMMSPSGAGDFPLLILDSVKILVKDIKLDEAGNNNHHECDFRTGPFAVKLNLNGNVNVISTAMIPEGRYDRIKFEIHKMNPTQTPPDPDFSYMGGRFSVVAWGSYNGSAFVFRSKQSATQSLWFNPPATMNSMTKSNITLSVAPYSWFYDDGRFLTPGDDGDENKIDRNIKNSFRAFRDNDRNGIPDGP